MVSDKKIIDRIKKEGGLLFFRIQDKDRTIFQDVSNKFQCYGNEQKTCVQEKGVCAGEFIDLSSWVVQPDEKVVIFEGELTGIEIEDGYFVRPKKVLKELTTKKWDKFKEKMEQEED